MLATTALIITSYAIITKRFFTWAKLTSGNFVFYSTLFALMIPCSHYWSIKSSDKFKEMILRHN